MMENRKRNVHLHVMVTPDELAAIHERMAEVGISNAGAYVRKKMCIRDRGHTDPKPEAPEKEDTAHEEN